MSPARFLLRFDDLCPTANWEIWDRVEALLVSRGINPLVAVVPNNRNPALEVGATDFTFWQRVRDWQSRGWSVGLHGYDHVYRTAEPGVLRINRFSEFAGVPFDQQRAAIDAGLAIFARERIRPDAWVAPAHSFDRATLRALRGFGLRVISDGYFHSPFTDRDGMVWVPQQLWSLRPQGSGAWTVCYHVNSWSRDDVDRFAAALVAFRSQLVGLQALVESAGRRRGIRDVLFDRYWRAAQRARSKFGPLARAVRSGTEARIG